LIHQDHVAMAAIFLSFLGVKVRGHGRSDSRAASEIEHRRLCGATRFQSRNDDHLQIDRPPGTRHPILKDRQLPAQEVFIDPRQPAWLQRSAIRESFRGTGWLMAGDTAKSEKEKRAGECPKLG
jgi:hypothetical protein